MIPTNWMKLDKVGAGEEIFKRPRKCGRMVYQYDLKW
jgi:hypothetical protein